jgi:formate C-acetyltransferase
MPDCVARGQDNTEGGARYYHKTLSLVGFGTLCDSLLRLREAYADGSVDALLAATERSFEDAALLRRRLQEATDRFGHSDAADAFAAALAEDLAGVSRGIRTAKGVEWCTSLFTYHLFRSFGERCGATPDGRLAGEPLSRQMNMAALPAPTAAALSLSKLSDADFHDVGILDLTMPLQSFNEEETRKTLAGFLRTCLELRIPVLQPNVVDRKTLLEERAQKGTHPDLVVRVCGYSAYYGQLPPKMQDEILARTEA